MLSCLANGFQEEEEKGFKSQLPSGRQKIFIQEQYAFPIRKVSMQKLFWISLLTDDLDLMPY